MILHLTLDRRPVLFDRFRVGKLAGLRLSDTIPFKASYNLINE